MSSERGANIQRPCNPSGRSHLGLCQPVPGEAGLLFGLVSGLGAISCCVSPVVLVLLGVATAAEAMSLGDTLYYTYGWLFRGVGVLVATIAVVLYLRGRRSCSLPGARDYRLMLLSLVLAGGATCVGLFWSTKYLGLWFG